MCHSTDYAHLMPDSIEGVTPPPMTEEAADAFRAYMHGLDRQAAIDLGEDPDTICPRCGSDKAKDAKWCASCTDWQERYDEASAPCAACGYVESDTGATQADNAHDNLCCGTVECSWPGECATHDPRNILEEL